jgi:adenosylhomocysteine nucleosidase
MGEALQPLGVLTAMEEEFRRIRELVAKADAIERGGRRYLRGTIGGHPVVAAFSRWGKTAAASTATTLIERFGVGRILFTGVAGGAAPSLGIGDLVVAERLVHHDLDARPFIRRFEVPLLDLVEIPADGHLSSIAAAAAEAVLREDLAAIAPDGLRESFGMAAPSVRRGLVASGDRFMADAREVASLRESLPGLLAVEMEGAAVAQVCFEHGVPCAVVRAISDRADHAAALDFAAFVAEIASRFSERLVARVVEQL